MSIEPYPTLGELVRIVDDLTASREEASVVLNHLFRTGRVRLRRFGQAAGAAHGSRDGRVARSQT